MPSAIRRVHVNFLPPGAWSSEFMRLYGFGADAGAIKNLIQRRLEIRIRAAASTAEPRDSHA